MPFEQTIPEEIETTPIFRADTGFVESKEPIEPAAASSQSMAFLIWKAFVILIFFVFMAGFVLLMVIDSMPDKRFDPPKSDDSERVIPGEYRPEIAE